MTFLFHIHDHPWRNLGHICVVFNTGDNLTHLQLLKTYTHSLCLSMSNSSDQLSDFNNSWQ